MTEIVRFNNGKADLALPKDQFISYMASLRPDVRANIKILGKDKGFDSVIQPVDSPNLTRQRMSAEQVKRRMDLGEQPIVTGGDDPKLQAFMRQEQAKTEHDIISNESNLLAMRGSLPTSWVGVQQRWEDEALGSQAEGQEYRRKMWSAKPVATTMGYGLPIFAATATGVGALGAAAGLSASSMFAAELIGTTVIGETALYTRQLLDTGGEWSSEHLASNIMQGLLVGGAMYAGFGALRLARAGLRGAGAAAETAANAADAMVGAGVLNLTKHSNTLFKLSAGTRVLGRIARRVGGKKGPIKSSVPANALKEVEKTMAKSEKAISKFRVGHLTEETANDLIPEVAKYSDVGEDVLRGINYKEMNRNISGIDNAVANTKKVAETANRSILDGKHYKDLGLDKETFIPARDVLYSQMDEVGYGAYTSHLQGATHQGQFVQARLNAVLNPEVGGAAEAQVHLKNFLEDYSMGSEWAQRGKAANEAIERIVQARKALDDLGVPGDLRHITGKNGTSAASLNKAHTELGEMMESYQTLRDHGFVSEGARREVQGVTNSARKAMIEGQKSYADAAVINKARESASIKHNEAFAALKNGVVEANAADVVDGAMNFAVRMERLNTIIEKGAKAAGIAVGTYGVMARNVSYNDKKELYKDFRHAITEMAANPQALEARVAEMGYGAEPKAQMKAIQQMYYMLGTFNPEKSDLYSRGEDPPFREVETFWERMATFSDPMSVAEAALIGEPVTEAMMGVLRNAFPAKYAEMSAEMAAIIEKNDWEKLPRPVRLNISRFMGGLDPITKPENLARLGQDFSQTQEQVQAGGVQIGPQKPPSANNNFTLTQKLSAY